MNYFSLLAGISFYALGFFAPISYERQLLAFFIGAFYILRFLFLCLKNYNQSE